MNRTVFACGLMAFLLALTGCQEAEAPPEPIRPVLSMVVRPQVLHQLLLAGTVEPQVQTELSFRVVGRLIARDVSVGDLVRNGQRVAAIDPVVLELAVRSAQAELSSAIARLANASSVEERQRLLVEADASTKALLEEAQLQLQTARAAVARAKANLAKAEVQRGYAQLVAEFDGVVTAISGEIGQTVLPGQPIVTIARTDVREAVIDIPDQVSESLQVGTPFDVALELDPSIRAAGAVREIAPSADPTTRTRRVRITLDSPPGSFRFGTTVIASRATEAGSTFVVPESALLERDGRTVVWVIDSATATVSRRELIVGGRVADSVTIIKGLDAGTRIATAGVHSLQEGQKVRIDAGEPR